MSDTQRNAPRIARARWLAIVAGSLGLLAAVIAAVEFRGLRHVTTRDLSLAGAEMSPQADGLCGTFKEGLPKYRCRWDGEPPRAWLVDRRSGEAIAPPLMLKSSLSLNARGVLWTGDKECRFAVDRATALKLGDNLVLRLESYPTRTTFYICVGAALLGWLVALFGAQRYRILSAPAWRQGRIQLDETRAMVFVLLSLALILVFYPGHPVPHMSGDPANIHSFAAGISDPDTFKGDAVLSDERNFKWYTPVYVMFVRLFGDAGFHFGTSRALLVVVSGLAGLFGYYSLFRLISCSRSFALVSTLALLFLKAHYPANEDWGPMLVLPRTVYGAFLPWVVVGALRLLPKPHLWWVAAGASAVLFYVHPVSSPALTGAILTAFVCGGPGKLPKRLAWGICGAVVALAVMFPYVMIYAGKYKGTVVADPTLTKQAFEVARQRFDPAYLSPLVFYRDLAVHMLISPRHWLGLAGLYLLCRYRWKSLTTRVSLGMVIGYVIVTCLIPTLDVLVSSRMGRLPFQIDLIRNLRYLDVLCLGLTGAALREMNRPDWGRNWKLRWNLSVGHFWQPPEFAWRLVPVAAVTWVLIFFVPPFIRSSFRLVEFSYDNLTLLVGKPNGEMANKVEAFRAVRTMRRADEVVGGDFHMRQMGIPVACNNKDLGVLAYSSPERLVRAKEMLNEVNTLSRWPLDESAATDQAAVLNAQLLLLTRESVAPALARSEAVLFQNAQYVLVRVDPVAVLARQTRKSPPETPLQLTDKPGTTRY